MQSAALASSRDRREFSSKRLVFVNLYKQCANYRNLKMQPSVAAIGPDWTKSSTVPGLYSDAFYTIEDVALFATDKTFSVSKASDIHGRNIGVVRGYGFVKFDEAFHSGKAIRTDTKNELHLLEMLYHNRADAIFISRHVYYHHANQNEKYREFVIGDVIGAYEVGVRVHPSANHILPLLNRAIQTLKLNGTIRAIMSRDQPLSGIKKPAH